MTTATFSEFAALLGVSPSYVTKLKQSGRLVLASGGRSVQVEESRARIKETEDPSRDDVRARYAAKRAAEPPPSEPDTSPPPATPPAIAIDSTYSRARAVKERYLALSAKLDYERASGAMVETAAVKAAAADLGAALRAKIENFPDQIAPLLATLSDETEIRVRLKENLDLLLHEIADRAAALMQNLAEPPA